MSRFLILLLSALSLLLIPLIAMAFSEEVNWTVLDFGVMGGLLTVLALVTEFIIRKTTSSSRRIGLIALACVGFLVVWIELAVGIF